MHKQKWKWFEVRRNSCNLSIGVLKWKNSSTFLIIRPIRNDSRCVQPAKHDGIVRRIGCVWWFVNEVFVGKGEHSGEHVALPFPHASTGYIVEVPLGRVVFDGLLQLFRAIFVEGEKLGAFYGGGHCAPIVPHFRDGEGTHAFPLRHHFLRHLFARRNSRFLIIYFRFLYICVQISRAMKHRLSISVYLQCATRWKPHVGSESIG